MPLFVQYLVSLKLIYDLSGFHHDHPVTDHADGREIVGNKQNVHAEPGLQAFQQLQDLGLYRYIQAGGRLIANQQLGIQTDPAAIATRCFCPPLISCGYRSK